MSLALHPNSEKARETFSDTVFVRMCLHAHSSRLMNFGNRLELSRSYGNEPAVLGLLKVYKKFYPDVIVNQSVAGKPSIFEVLRSCTASCDVI